jgi:hypothetical protein
MECCTVLLDGHDSDRGPASVSKSSLLSLQVGCTSSVGSRHNASHLQP